MRHKLIPKILLVPLIFMLALAQHSWAFDMTDPGGNVVLTDSVIRPIGGSSEAPGALRLDPLDLTLIHYQENYDQATRLLGEGETLHNSIIPIPATTITEALQNYSDFNGGALFHDFCSDYDAIDAGGRCPPGTENVRNKLMDAMGLFGGLAVAPSNVKIINAGSEMRSASELGREGAVAAAREIASIHLIFGNEFLVDASDYRYSTGGIPNADQIIAMELGELESAQRQFELALEILAFAFNAPLGGEISYGWQECGRMGDYFTSRDFELFGVTSNRLMTTLDEQAARYRVLGQPDRAFAVYRDAFTAQYMQLVAIAQMAQKNNQAYLVDGSWEMLNNLSRLRQQAQAIENGLDPFGYAPEYAPLQSFQDLLDLVEGPTGDTGLLGTASGLESAARAAQRLFETNYVELSDEWESLQVELDDELFDMCGPSEDDYVTCEGGLMEQNYHDMEISARRAAQAWNEAANIARRIKAEEERVGQVINITLGLGQTLSVAELSIGKLNAYKETRVVASSSEDRETNSTELSERLYVLTEFGFSADCELSFGICASAMTGFEFAAEWRQGWEHSDVYITSDEATWDPNEEEIGTWESLKALKEAEAAALIEGANSAFDIRNMLIDQDELLLEWETAMAEFNKIVAEHNFLAQKRARLINKRAQLSEWIYNIYSPITNPAYRIIRDTLTVQAVETHARAAQFAYLAARAVEYDLLTPYPDIGKIYKARTAADIRQFLDNLKIYYQGANRPGTLNRYPRTISVAKYLLGLSDQNLDPTGAMTPGELADLRYQRFQEFLQDYISPDGNTLEIPFATSLEVKVSETQYMFSPNIWNNRIAGIGTPLPENQGVKLNIVTRQTGDVGLPEVVLIHDGRATYRSYEKDSQSQPLIVEYDPGTAVLVGYQLPSGLNPKNTTVVLIPGINGEGAVPNAGLQNLSVAAAAWTLRIPASSKGELDYGQIEDIEIILDTSGRAIPALEMAALRDALYLQGQFDGESLRSDQVMDGFEGLPMTAAARPPQTGDAPRHTEYAIRNGSTPLVSATSTDAISGTYIGAVMITSPLPIGVQELGFEVTEIDGTLSGRVSISHTQVFTGDISLSGVRNGDTFTLASETFEDVVMGQTVQERFTLVGEILEDGDVLRGRYTGEVFGYTSPCGGDPQPLVIGGTFLGSRFVEPGRGLNALGVKVEPYIVPVNETAQVTVGLFASFTTTTHITLSADLGAITPQTVDATEGLAYATFTAGAASGWTTIVATNGDLTGTAQVNIFAPNTPVGLQVRAERETISISGSTVISAFLVNKAGQPLAASTRITFTTNLGQVTPQAANTDADGLAQVTFTASITPGLATVHATDGQFEADVQVRMVDPAVPDAIQVQAEHTAIPLDGSTVISAAVLNGLGEVLTPTMCITFTSDLGNVSPPAIDTDANGLAVVTFNGGSTAGQATISATDGNLSSQTQVEIVDPAIPTEVRVQVEPASVQINSSAVVTATLYNGLGQHLSHSAHFSFTTDLGTVTPPGVDTSTGVAVATFNAGSTPGRAVIVATSGSVYGTAQVQITGEGSDIYLPLILRN